MERKKSLTMSQADTLTIRHVDINGDVTPYKMSQCWKEKYLIASAMSYRGLTEFLQEAIKDSKRRIRCSPVRLKATMMKVSDPIIFGAVVKAYYADVFEKYGDVFEEIGFDANNGMRTLDQIESLEPSL